MKRHSIPLHIAATLLLWSVSIIAKAQCTFDLDVQVLQQATCPANGIVQVTLSGDDVDLDNVLISLNSTNGLINESSTTNDIQFTSLPPYEYNITARAKCKGTLSDAVRTTSVTVQSQYDMLNAATGIDKAKSFSCINTGKFSFEIHDGRLPYTVSLNQIPEKYTGTTELTYPAEGMKSISELAAGNYLVQITDGCLSSVPLTLTVEQLASDFPANPFADKASATNTCDGATVQYTNLSSDDEMYSFWYNRRNYYEVAFTVDGSEKIWLPTNNYTSYTPQSFTLPQSYRTLYESGKPVDVWMRLIGTDCEEKVDVLQLNAPSAVSLYVSNTLASCSTFDTRFYFQSTSGAAQCPPYSWEIRDGGGALIDSASDVANFTSSTAQTSAGLQVNTDYTLTVWDSENFQIGTRAIRYNTTAPSLYSKSPSQNCRNYDLTYSLNGNICYPVTREIFNGIGTLLRTETLTAYTNIPALEYDSTYRVVLTDVVGNIVAVNHTTSHPQYTSRTTPRNCDDYDLNIRPYMFCGSNYVWTLMTTDSVVIAQSADSVPTNRYETIYGLQYGTAYILKVSDFERTIFEQVSTTWTPPYWDYFSDRDRQCADYEFYFSVYNIYCLPYRWEIYDSEGTLVRNGVGTAAYQIQSTRLPYNEDFTVKIIDSKGVTVLERVKRVNNTTLTNYSYSTYTSVATPCYNDEYPHRGYMYIYSYDGIDVGTAIRFVSGPQRPLHDSVSFTQRYTYFYPFSQNYNTSEQVVIADGDYIFEITDPCGTKRNVTIPFKNNTLEVRGFSYIKDDEADFCNGVSRVYPQGLLYENGTRLSSTYFHLMETPSGTLPLYPSSGSVRIQNSTATQPYYGDYFSFTQSGKYVIGISRSGTSSTCIFDTIVIYHTRKSPELEGRSSYVCSEGGNGQIIIAAKNGREPYSYELQTATGSRVSITDNPNTTGIFEFGALGENYKVVITDACNKSFPIDLQINTLDQIPFISGTDKICAGGEIELSCLLIGAQAYQWSGPDNFSSASRVVIIPNATASNAGEYTINVKPFGCADFMEKKHSVNVYASLPPVLPDTVYLCNYVTPYQLAPTPELGYTVQWFDSDTLPLPIAPTVDLTTQAEYTFFAMQTDDELGCESPKAKVVVTRNVPANMIIHTTMSHSICTGDSLLFGNRYLQTGDTYIDTLSSVTTGCDSIITLHLTVNPKYEFTTDTTVCTNKLPFHWRGKYYSSSDTYYDSLQTVPGGCDSIYVLKLTVNPLLSKTIDRVICQGESYLFNAKNYTVTGTYNDTITGAGCDTAVVIKLRIQDKYEFTTDTTVCPNSLPFSWRGADYSASDTYYDSLRTAIGGCDSVYVLKLTVNNLYEKTIDKVICQGTNYTFNAKTYNTTGAYNDTIAGLGCDTAIVIKLLVQDKYEFKTDTVVCANRLPFHWHGKDYSSSNTYYDSLHTVLGGCDSVYVLNLTINPLLSKTIDRVICQGESYIFNAKSYTATGTYNDTIAGAGCDTAVVIKLQIQDKYEFTTDTTVCTNSLPFSWRGADYVVSGTYYDSLQTIIGGCDSIYVLRLTVNSTNRTELKDTANIGEPYAKNGFSLPIQNIVGSKVDSIMLQNRFGCDSVVVLNLEVICQSKQMPPVNVDICEGDTYFFKGNYQNVSGTYRDTLKTAIGCDSIITFILTVRPSHETLFTARIPVDMPYEEHGFFVSPQPTPTSLTFEKTLNNSYGCDSLLILHLTIYTFIYPDKYFSPNGDGIRDVWNIKNIEYVEYEFIEIYDRFGKLLRRWEDNFTGWDGYYLGKPMPSTDYWYIINLKDEVKPYTGHFTLLR